MDGCTPLAIAAAAAAAAAVLLAVRRSRVAAAAAATPTPHSSRTVDTSAPASNTADTADTAPSRQRPWPQDSNAFDYADVVPAGSTRGGASVVTLGPLLMGQDKWLGGVSSPCGRFIYGVPGHAKTVLRITVATGDVNTIGGPYEGKFKWLRGVEVPAAVCGAEAHPCGLVFALPSNADTVLRIDPATQVVSELVEGSNGGGKGGAAAAVGSGGAAVTAAATAAATAATAATAGVAGAAAAASAGVEGAAGGLAGDWKWHGGNLGCDGMIYGIPGNAASVIRVDPRTSEVAMVGAKFEGRQKWYGGIVASSGSIYGIPQTATGVLKITPVGARGNEAGTEALCEVVGEGLPVGGWKWHGGIATEDGHVIYGYPNHADTVLKIDTRTDTVTLIGGPSVLKSGRHRVPQDGKYKYLGGAIGGDGHVYCFPCDAERVLKVDVNTDEVSVLGPSFLHAEVGQCVNKWQNGFQGRDGAVYAIPQRSRGVLRVMPAGGVGGIGGAGDDAEEKGKGGDDVALLDCGDEYGTYSDGKDKFEGGVMGSDGCIYCIPLRAKRVLKIIPGPAVSLEPLKRTTCE